MIESAYQNLQDETLRDAKMKDFEGEEEMENEQCNGGEYNEGGDEAVVAVSSAGSENSGYSNRDSKTKKSRSQDDLKRLSFMSKRLRAIKKMSSTQTTTMQKKSSTKKKQPDALDAFHKNRLRSVTDRSNLLRDRFIRTGSDQSTLSRNSAEGSQTSAESKRSENDRYFRKTRLDIKPSSNRSICSDVTIKADNKSAYGSTQSKPLARVGSDTQRASTPKPRPRAIAPRRATDVRRQTRCESSSEASEDIVHAAAMDVTAMDVNDTDSVVTITSKERKVSFKTAGDEILEFDADASSSIVSKTADKEHKSLVEIVPGQSSLSSASEAATVLEAVPTDELVLKLKNKVDKLKSLQEEEKAIAKDILSICTTLQSQLKIKQEISETVDDDIGDDDQSVATAQSNNTTACSMAKKLEDLAKSLFPEGNGLVTDQIKEKLRQIGSALSVDS